MRTALHATCRRNWQIFDEIWLARCLSSRETLILFFML